ncbi:MAG: SpoIID/LytB domain-containing protein [Candidatus Omnitrophica bacterium]|nr:SpoIID/LytB domain-containing protein [Candidatus Omnitrophota bacterium]
MILAVALLCVRETFVTARSKFVRVVVLQAANHFVFGVDGRYAIMDFSSGGKLETRDRLKPTMVVLDKGHIKIGDKIYDNERLIIEPRDQVISRINDKHFRGNVTIINNKGLSLSVINSVDLEYYVRGVLYHEISDKWPLEAIKAQAVATRTYALYAMDTYAARDYDVTNDIYSQVYGGKSAERYRTSIAVQKTKGEIMAWQGKIFPTFFHANSGGITEDAGELWDVNLPPLKGGVESPFSVNSPHYRWKRNFRLKDIQDKLKVKGVMTERILDIKVVERNKSGRVSKLEIKDDVGKNHTVTGKAFRDAIGPNILRSNKYDVQMKGWYVDFIGHGWGHGVGLDQWGAYNMALAHYSYKQILQFYYPGAELARQKDID